MKCQFFIVKLNKKIKIKKNVLITLEYKRKLQLFNEFVCKTQGSINLTYTVN